MTIAAMFERQAQKKPSDDSEKDEEKDLREGALSSMRQLGKRKRAPSNDGALPRSASSLISLLRRA